MRRYGIRSNAVAPGGMANALPLKRGRIDGPVDPSWCVALLAVLSFTASNGVVLLCCCVVVAVLPCVAVLLCVVFECWRDVLLCCGVVLWRCVVVYPFALLQTGMFYKAGMVTNYPSAVVPHCWCLCMMCPNVQRWI
jgi:hypothetical protein